VVSTEYPMKDENSNDAIGLTANAAATPDDAVVEPLPLKVRALRSTLRTSLSAGTFRLSPLTKKQ
jgi:hypothetical protein